MAAKTCREEQYQHTSATYLFSTTNIKSKEDQQEALLHHRSSSPQRLSMHNDEEFVALRNVYTNPLHTFFNNAMFT